MRRLLPIILAIIGLAAGGGAGIMLRPAPPPIEAEGEGDHAASAEAGAEAGAESAEAEASGGEEAHAGEEGAGPEYVKLNNQFIVPIVDDGNVGALVILALSLEVTTGGTDLVYAREPKLRDVFLRVLFDHANSGGFRGTFTQSSEMDDLRRALREVAQKVLGNTVRDVLIIEIVRQDHR